MHKFERADTVPDGGAEGEGGHEKGGGYDEFTIKERPSKPQLTPNTYLYDLGEKIIHRGERLDELLLVYEGSVEIVSDDLQSGAARQRNSTLPPLLAKVLPVLGGSDFFRRRPSRCEYVALGPCKIVPLTIDEMRSWADGEGKQMNAIKFIQGVPLSPDAGFRNEVDQYLEPWRHLHPEYPGFVLAPGRVLHISQDDLESFELQDRPEKQREMFRAYGACALNIMRGLIKEYDHLA